MGTLLFAVALVMAVSMDEHKVIFLVILVVSIHMMDFEYVLVSEAELAVATSSLLLSEHAGCAWREQRTVP